jgi:hypothetical protein
MDAQSRYFSQTGVMFETLREAAHTGLALVTDEVIIEEHQQEESFFDNFSVLSDAWNNPLHILLGLIALQGFFHGPMSYYESASWCHPEGFF